MKMELLYSYILQKNNKQIKNQQRRKETISESVPFIVSQVHSKVPIEAELELQTPLCF